MSIGQIGGIAFQLVAFALVGFAAGELILRWSGLLPDPRKVLDSETGFVDESGRPARGGFVVVWVGITERMLMSIVGFVAFSVALMVIHIVTWGHIFGVPGAVPVAGLAVVWWWRRTRRVEPLPRPRPVSYLKLGALLLVAGAIYVTPMFVSGSSIRTGDPPWHLGWTEQLLAGEQFPVGPAPEFARNAYPWGLHATMSTLVRLAPGTDPLTSLETLHLILLAGLPMVAACFAFRLHERAGWAAAAAAALIGGFGWMSAGEPDFITSPSNARHGADLVVASPNSVYELFPPALPRELGVVLLGAAGLFALMAVRNRIRRAELLAGACAGLAGLVSVPMFVSSVIWMTAVSLAVRTDRGRFVKHTLGGAGLVFALWGLPTIIDYVRFGGFVSITPRLGVEWPPHVALASWGLLLPLAAGGLWIAYRRRATEDRALIAVTGGTAVVLALSMLRGVFDWDMWGNATLLHQGRVWPPLHLLGAVFAGGALMWLYDRIRHKTIATVSVCAILAVGAISPVFASIHLTDVMERGAAGFVYAREDIRSEDSFVRSVASHLGPDDVVHVEDSSQLAFLLFQFSGARLSGYSNPHLDGNDLRIRFADLAARYDEAAADGFDPNFFVFPQGEVPEAYADFEPTVTGEFGGDTWVLIGEIFTFAG